MLHDVVEDSEYTLEDLKNEGFSDEVLEALKLLTHDKNEDYFEYVQRLKDNVLAKSVKLTDLAHNSELSRLKIVTEKDMARVEKYKKAMRILGVEP
jgi:(p)ppGpp synthase/HD superfamily hydrolase